MAFLAAGNRKYVSCRGMKGRCRSGRRGTGETLCQVATEVACRTTAKVRISDIRWKNRPGAKSVSFSPAGPGAAI